MTVWREPDGVRGFGQALRGSRAITVASDPARGVAGRVSAARRPSPATGRYYVGVTSDVYGTAILASDDGSSWTVPGARSAQTAAFKWR